MMLMKTSDSLDMLSGMRLEQHIVPELHRLPLRIHGASDQIHRSLSFWTWFASFHLVPRAYWQCEPFVQMVGGVRASGYGGNGSAHGYAGQSHCDSPWQLLRNMDLQAGLIPRPDGLCCHCEMRRRRVEKHGRCVLVTVTAPL